MEKTLARILSITFHPLLLPSVGMLILFNSGSILEYLPFQAKKVILMVVSVSTLILPFTFVPFFIFQKIIKNVQMENSRERLIPFFVTSVLYAFCYYLLLRLGAPPTVSKFMLAAAATVLTLFVLTLKWKISAHMIGIGSLTGALIVISFNLSVNLEYFIIVSIIISGVLGYSRLKLSSHEPYQVYTGWLVGLLVSISVLFFF